MAPGTLLIILVEDPQFSAVISNISTFKKTITVNQCNARCILLMRDTLADRLRMRYFEEKTFLFFIWSLLRFGESGRLRDRPEPREKASPVRRK